jgi:hypothetical protein
MKSMRRLLMRRAAPQKMNASGEWETVTPMIYQLKTYIDTNRPHHPVRLRGGGEDW